MASLKEIKGRIASVGNTLKITSAMKMVASAKLHRTQGVKAALSTYAERLEQLARAAREGGMSSKSRAWYRRPEAGCRVAVVAMASDSSLCGAFNHGAIKALHEEARRLGCAGYEVEIYPIGEKMAQAIKKAGYRHTAIGRIAEDERAYGQVAALTDHLTEGYLAGDYGAIYLLHNHFFSMGHQSPITSTLLPLEAAEQEDSSAEGMEYIIEPDAETLLERLQPYLLRVRLYEALLDSRLAEHAARMIAMQTATDNASALLDELQLSYNKGRQQAITNELADITQAAEG